MSLIAGVRNWVPALLVDPADNSPKLGVAYDDPGLSIKYSLNGGPLVTFTPTADDWQELETGCYSIRLPAVFQRGSLFYIVTYTGAEPYRGKDDLRPLGRWR